MDADEPGRQPDIPAEVFAQIPLFREIQRVLLSSSGPVNWELARQVGVAVAASAGPDATPAQEDRRGLEDTVRAAELHVAEHTGLPSPTDVADVRTMGRTAWVGESIPGLKELVDPPAARMAEVFGRIQGEGLPEQAGPLGAMLGQVVPLLLGAQAGTVLGALAQRALGQYDVALPRPAGASTWFVLPNMAAFERDWSLPPVEFRAWVALREVVFRFAFARPWAREHALALVREYAAGMEIDVAGLQERLEHLDIADPEALQGLLRADQGLPGVALDGEQRLRMARLQAFLAAAQGYAEHVTHVVGARLLHELDRIEEAVRRDGETEGAEAVFERLLGIEMTAERYRLGREFCDRVVELTDETTLGRMWEGPEAMPSTPELEEPRLWLARMA